MIEKIQLNMIIWAKFFQIDSFVDLLSLFMHQLGSYAVFHKTLIICISPFVNLLTAHLPIQWKNNVVWVIVK